MRTFAALLVIMITFSASAQKLEKTWSSKRDLQTPESVLFDSKLNTVFVANMGKIFETNNKDGFIAQMNLKGEITILKWVSGLNDPKGMAIKDGILYVADLKELALIDIKGAKIIKRYPSKTARFLNDVIIDDNGVVYVSDSHDQRIYTLQNDQFTSWLNNEQLKDVNGLWFENGKLYAGNSSIWEIDIATKKMTALVNETGGIDGLESIGKGNFIFSNWNGKIYISDKDKITKLVDTSDKRMNTADIDYIPEQKLVLVPTFFGNNVEAYKLEW